MIRKMLAASVAVMTMFFGVLALNAGAQGVDNSNTCGYYLGNPAGCADAVAYTGPFTNHPAAPTGPYGWGSLNVVASAPAAAAGTGGGNAAAALAHTGSESTAIAYVGTGMIAFGAVALGSRRKFFQGALED